MTYEKPSRYAGVAVAALALLSTIDCVAQAPSQTQAPEETQHRTLELPQDHSCTVDAAGTFFALSEGRDGQNFDKGGWGVQAGGGFAVTRQSEASRGNRWYITSNFMYAKFKATTAALDKAKSSNPTQLASATSAHGGFSAVTVDPSIRHSFNRRFSVYGLGGFGWLRRGVDFNGANPATLLQSNGISLDRLASNSGVFDAGAGANFGLSKNGGLMIFVEARWYRGLAINGGTTLVPFSAGVRW